MAESFKSFTSKVKERLQERGVHWGPAWNLVKEKFPQYSNEAIDNALGKYEYGIDWSKGGAFEEYQKHKAKYQARKEAGPTAVVTPVTGKAQPQMLEEPGLRIAGPAEPTPLAKYGEKYPEERGTIGPTGEYVPPVKYQPAVEEFLGRPYAERGLEMGPTTPETLTTRLLGPLAGTLVGAAPGALAGAPPTGAPTYGIPPMADYGAPAEPTTPTTPTTPVGPSLEQLLKDAQAAFDAAYAKWQEVAPEFGFAPFDEALVRQQVAETSGLPEYYQRMLSQFLHQVPEKYGYYGARSGAALRELGLGRQQYKEERTEALETELYRRKQEEYEPTKAAAREEWMTGVHEPYMTGAPKIESYLYPAFAKYLK